MNARVAAPSVSFTATPSMSAPRVNRFSLHSILFALLFVVMAHRQLRPNSDPRDLVIWLFLILAGVAAVQFAISRFFQNPEKPRILLTLGVIFFCFFGDFKVACERSFWKISPVLASATLLLPVWGLLFIAACVGLWRWRGALAKLERYLTVVALALLASEVVAYGKIPRAIAPPVSDQLHQPLQVGAHPPDIYFILTDGYTSPESLLKFWGYDDSAFTDFLKTRGFQVLPNAHGNATFTPQCLSTYLNMRYPPGLATNFSMESQAAYLGKIIENAEAPSRLKASGYDITALSIFATAGQPRYYYFPKISPPGLADVLWNKTPAGFLDAYRRRAGFGDINLGILDKLPKIAATENARPKFVYAHLMMPHGPYLFDKDGRRIRRGMGIDDDHKELYLGQLIYENTLLTNTIAAILRNSKTPPIIVLQGDHGYRALPGIHRVEEASTILNALYLPGFKTAAIPAGMTPVNTFRFIFNLYFDAHYSMLPDNAPTGVTPFVTPVY